jgi:hypothetical protein
MNFGILLAGRELTNYLLMKLIILEKNIGIEFIENIWE